MENHATTLTKITPQYDPWEAYMDIEEHGKLTLSSIEFTTTYLCNMRCEHCAVGYMLAHKDPDALPIELLLARLDEIPHLRTISLTGGEPMFSKKSVANYVLPLLKYAHARGVRTQMNSNLTMPLERYMKIAPYLDVLHISHNWGTIDDFVDGGFANMERKPSRERRAEQFQRMIDNSRALAEAGVMVSAETMLNKRTLPHLKSIHSSKNVTVRNDPDGRSRLNVNIFTGEVIVTDFGDTPAMGNIQKDSLPAMLDRWLERPLAKTIGCHCPAAKCLGPNLLVKDAYYPGNRFHCPTIKNYRLIRKARSSGRV